MTRSIAFAAMKAGSRLAVVIAAFVSVWAAATAFGQIPHVTITGGLKEDGSYQWEVVNQHSSPVVYVEFPHFQADMFYVPPGWKSKSTYLVNVGVEKRPGVCTAWVDSPREGISIGSRAQFGMRVRQHEARLVLGEVLVRFADGNTLTISGVELPGRPGLLDRFGLLICFAVFFAILGLIMARKKRRDSCAPAAGA